MRILLEAALEIEKYTHDLIMVFMVSIIIVNASYDEKGSTRNFEVHNREINSSRWEIFLVKLKAFFFYFCPTDKLPVRFKFCWADLIGFEKKLDKLRGMIR